MGVFFLRNSTTRVYLVDCTTFHYPQHEKLVFVARRFSASSPSAITHCTRAHSHAETREAEIQVKLFQRQLKINVKSHTTTIYSLVHHSPIHTHIIIATCPLQNRQIIRPPHIIDTPFQKSVLRNPHTSNHSPRKPP